MSTEIDLGNTIYIKSCGSHGLYHGNVQYSIAMATGERPKADTASYLGPVGGVDI